MTSTDSEPRRRHGGQILPLFILGLVALIAATGLVIDGGNAFAQQRRTQNGSDAAAEAGATVLMRMMAGATTPAGGWDGAVQSAVQTIATANGVTPGQVLYTDISGNTVATVGAGSIPSTAAGVAVTASRTVSTFIAGAIGIPAVTATAGATAVTGFLRSSCDASAGCQIVPIAVPLTLTVCNGSNANEFGSPAQPWPIGSEVAIPLCGNSPGNVGWIDWTPPSGGTSELASAISTPSNPTINYPSWQYITQTGNVNSSSVQNALDALVGTTIWLPIFYSPNLPVCDATTAVCWSPPDPLPGTCDTTPASPQTSLSDCPNADRGGNGSNQWYFLVTFAAFRLDAAYINGNGAIACNQPSLVVGGNGATSCLIGAFLADIMTGGTGTVTSTVQGDPRLTPRAVQLIK